MLTPAHDIIEAEEQDEFVYLALQGFFKEDINSFERNSLVDWVGKILPAKALIRVASETGKHKLIDIGGKQLDALIVKSPTKYEICLSNV